MTITVEKTNDTMKVKLSDVTEDNYDVKKNAFVGFPGSGSRDLYIVTYDSIILAKDPFCSWGAKDCLVCIERWVDIEITIKQEKEL